MSLVSRDWRCLNGTCAHIFHSFEKANPPCPECGCVRVDWVPGGGHILDMAPRMDARLRSISDQHGGMNLNSASPSRLNRAAPRIDVPPPSPDLGTVHFAPGFSAPVSRHGPMCVPSSSPVDLRGKVQIGVARDSSASIPGPSANAIVEARHRPDRPIR
jgi:hypothetical protein